MEDIKEEQKFLIKDLYRQEGTGSPDVNATCMNQQASFIHTFASRTSLICLIGILRVRLSGAIHYPYVLHFKSNSTRFNYLSIVILFQCPISYIIIMNLKIWL
jgi:hypothetical protein